MRLAAVKSLLAVCLVCGCLHLKASVNTEDKPKDVDGWSKVKWGMSEEEILELFQGQAARDPEPWHNKKDGLVNMISIKKMEIAGGMFRVQFGFDPQTKKLAKVEINPSDAVGGVSKWVVTDIQKMLAEKYGPPSYTESKDKGRVQEKFSRWTFPLTVIELNLIESELIGRHNAMLTYRQNRKEGLDKL